MRSFFIRMLNLENKQHLELSENTPSTETRKGTAIYSVDRLHHDTVFPRSLKILESLSISKNIFQLLESS